MKAFVANREPKREDLERVLAQGRVFELHLIKAPHSIEEAFQISASLPDWVRAALWTVLEGFERGSHQCMICVKPVRVPAMIGFLKPTGLEKGVLVSFAVCRECLDAEEWEERLHSRIERTLGFEHLVAGHA